MPKTCNILPIESNQQAPMENLLLPEECAKQVGVSVRTVMRWAEAGMFSVFNVGSVTRIYPDSWNDFMERNSKGRVTGA